MKKPSFLMPRLLLVGACVFSAFGQATTPVRVVVTSSFLVQSCTGVSFGRSNCGTELHIRAEIQGADLELSTQGRPYVKKTDTALLALGEYKAIISKNDSSKPYLTDQAYEFLFPDGEKQHFVVVGRFTR